MLLLPLLRIVERHQCTRHRRQWSHQQKSRLVPPARLRKLPCGGIQKMAHPTATLVVSGSRSIAFVVPSAATFLARMRRLGMSAVSAALAWCTADWAAISWICGLELHSAIMMNVHQSITTDQKLKMFYSHSSWYTDHSYITCLLPADFLMFRFMHIDLL